MKRIGSTVAVLAGAWMAMAPVALGQLNGYNGVNWQNHGFGLLYPLVDFSPGSDYNGSLRSLNISLGQLAGLHPSSGAALPADDLLPLMPREMDLTVVANRNFALQADQIAVGPGLKLTWGTPTLTIDADTSPGVGPWVLRAGDININPGAGLGVGRNVRLDFKGIPILYTPFISFPVGNQRKSGFLFPTLANSSRSGLGVQVPWYWNIAPNYDATFTGTWYTQRGFDLLTDFRFLTERSRGNVTAEYLPNDTEYGNDRNLVRLFDQTDFRNCVCLGLILDPEGRIRLRHTGVLRRDEIEAELEAIEAASSRPGDPTKG